MNSICLIYVKPHILCYKILENSAQNIFKQQIGSFVDNYSGFQKFSGNILQFHDEFVRKENQTNKVVVGEYGGKWTETYTTDKICQNFLRSEQIGALIHSMLG